MLGLLWARLFLLELESDEDEDDDEDEDEDGEEDEDDEDDEDEDEKDSDLEDEEDEEGCIEADFTGKIFVSFDPDPPFKAEYRSGSNPVRGFWLPKIDSWKFFFLSNYHFTYP